MSFKHKAARMSFEHKARMSFKHKTEVLHKYRGYAVWGGAMLGLIASIIATGPHLLDWGNPLSTWGAIVAGSGAVGALVGYLFFPLVVGSQSSSGESGDFGGGDGGGK